MMLVLYFKYDKASFQDQKFYLEGFQPTIKTQSTNHQYLGLEAKNEKIRLLYFLELYFYRFWPLG